MINGNLIQLQENQLRTSAEVLSRAFYDDPLFVYFFPDPSSRIKKSIRFFKLLARYSILYGECEATSPNLEGVTIWLPSDKKHKSFWGLLHSGMVTFILGGGLSVIIRMIRLGQYPEEVNKRYAPFPHWYLQVVGVDPSLQGKGYASKLLRGKLERFDQEGLACYLETQNEGNIPMYEHYGFQVVEEYILPNTTFNNWAMLRKPQK